MITENDYTQKWLPHQREQCATVLHDIFGFKNVYCLDQSLAEINSTGTFKDKQPQELAKLINADVKYRDTPLTIAAMSTGNTAFSLLQFSIDHNCIYGKQITPVIYIPHDLRNRQAFGPDTHGRTVSASDYIGLLERTAVTAGGKVIALDFGKPGDSHPANYISTTHLAKIAKQHGLLEIDSLFLNITEGMEHTSFIPAGQIKTITTSQMLRLPSLGIKAYERIIKDGLVDLYQKYGIRPDTIICPFGAGILYNETKEYVNSQWLPWRRSSVVPIAVGRADSCADKIFASYWVDEPIRLCNKGQACSNHDHAIVYGIEDDEIKRALSEVKGKVNSEASAAACFAILPRLHTIVHGARSQNHNILVINTGNGIPNFIKGTPRDGVN